MSAAGESGQHWACGNSCLLLIAFTVKTVASTDSFSLDAAGDMASVCARSARTASRARASLRSRFSRRIIPESKSPGSTTSRALNAFLTESSHRSDYCARAHLARHRDSSYHFSRVSESNQAETKAKECGQAACAPDIVAIVGPTASGKSALAIELALHLEAEIINCDSVQVYQKIQIATAKVPFAERRGIPHHLIDFVPPEVNFTAADWARAALETIEGIEARQRRVVIAGGTGFYLRALREPFFPSPATDEELRARLTRIRERRSPEYLHRILQRLDPAEASRLNPRDWPRVQRAIEFCLQTGESISTRKPLRPERPKLAS